MYDLLLFLWSRSVPQCKDVRFDAVALASKWCPNSKMYDLMPLFWPRSGTPNSKMRDLLPLLWSPSGAPMLRCTIRCRCFGLEVVPHCQDVRFVAVALVSKWCPSAKMYDCVALVWPRSGAPLLRCTTCCRCFGLEVVPQCQDVRFAAIVWVSKWCCNAKMYDLLPLLWSQSDKLIVRCTICCRCFGLEVVPQCQDVRFVAVALASKLLPLLWSRSGAPVPRCTICCRCYGLEVVPQF